MMQVVGCGLELEQAFGEINSIALAWGLQLLSKVLMRIHHSLASSPWEKKYPSVMVLYFEGFGLRIGAWGESV